MTSGTIESTLPLLLMRTAAARFIIHVSWFIQCLRQSLFIICSTQMTPNRFMKAPELTARTICVRFDKIQAAQNRKFKYRLSLLVALQTYIFSITLAISQYEKSTTIYFTLRAYSRDKFDLQKIDSGFVKKEEISGKWQGITAGGCPNNQFTYKNNPKYKLTVGTTPKHRPTISFELRAPKVFQVGFEISKLTGPEHFETISSGSYRSGYCALEIPAMPPGTYLIIPATYLPNQESPFFITVKSQNAFKLQEVTQDFEFSP